MDQKRKGDPRLLLLEGLDDGGGELSLDELRADLASRGLDPDRLVASVRGKVETFIKSQVWRRQATANRERLLATAADRVVSWLGRPPAEIERGVLAAIRGDWGPQAQAAFRDRTDDLTVEDKARILDDLDRLRRMEETAGDHGD